MSNDSLPPKPDSEKITAKTSKQAHEATEFDLWDLDSEESDFDSPVVPPPSEPAGLPARRNTGSPTLKSHKPTERHINVPAVESIKAIPKPEAKPARKPETKPEVGAEPAGQDNRTWEEPGDEQAAMDETKAQPEGKPALTAIASLSKVEKIAISCLFAALALGATLTLIHFSNRVPTRPLVAAEIDYPVKGEIVEITAASTHWRTPVTGGESADIVRRGTQLIPVLKLNLSSPSGAIRVFFRNEDGVVVGDGITRTVKGGAELTIAATAGFEDVGMHTAYRTGDSLPWVVQVFEGPNATAPREKFRKLLEKNISPAIR